VAGHEERGYLVAELAAVHPAARHEPPDDALGGVGGARRDQRVGPGRQAAVVPPVGDVRPGGDRGRERHERARAPGDPLARLRDARLEPRHVLPELGADQDAADHVERQPVHLAVDVELRAALREAVPALEQRVDRRLDRRHVGQEAAAREQRHQQLAALARLLAVDREQRVGKRHAEGVVAHALDVVVAVVDAHVRDRVRADHEEHALVRRAEADDVLAVRRGAHEQP
jgi:hypothetical protein